MVAIFKRLYMDGAFNTGISIGDHAVIINAVHLFQHLPSRRELPQGPETAQPAHAAVNGVDTAAGDKEGT